MNNENDTKISPTFTTSTISGDEYLQIGKASEPFFVNIASSEPPNFVIITGGIGTGKTTMRRDKFTENYVNFDFGEINRAVKRSFGEENPHLLEYSLWACSLILKESILEKKNIVVELIGDDYDKLALLINTMKEAGYEIHLDHLTCDPAEGQRRHILATQEDQNYLSSYFSQELTLLSLFTYFGAEVPTK